MSSSTVHPHIWVSVSECMGSLQTDLVFIFCRLQKKMYTIIPLAYYCQYILKVNKWALILTKVSSNTNNADSNVQHTIILQGADMKGESCTFTEHILSQLRVSKPKFSQLEVGTFP
jgi:hypothetical protein